MKQKLLTALAWLQLGTSLLFAAAILWGYATYQASLGQFLQSVSASIGAVSNVVARTAETVEARRDLLSESTQMLVVTRQLINELRAAAENQAKLTPQYADGVRSASSVTSNLSGTFKSIGTGLMVSLPTGIHWESLKPVVVMSQPLDRPAQQLLQNAQELKAVSDSLSGVANTISRDGQKLSAAVIATSNQALKVIAEIDKSLSRLNAQELPKALEDLRRTSMNLRDISAQVNIVGNIGMALFVVGLLLSVWCFLSSLSAINLANAYTSSQVTG